MDQKKPLSFLKTASRIIWIILNTKSEEIYPPETPWYYRWSIPGILAWKRFIDLTLHLDEEGRENADYTSVIQETLDQELESARWGCIYGRSGNECMKTLVETAEDINLATRSQLRTVIQSGDLRSAINGGVRVEIPFWEVLFSSLLILVFSVIVGVLVIPTFLSPIATLKQELFASGLLGALILYIFAFIDCVYRPYFLTKKLRYSLEDLADTLCINVLNSGIALKRAK